VKQQISEEKIKEIEQKKRTRKERNRDLMREEWKEERMR
jgi:hypothetical protein